MKLKSILLLIAFVFCGVKVFYAEEYSTDYVMLSPLDTASLPCISDKDSGGKVVRSVLESDAIWHYTHSVLARENFSYKSVYKIMVKMYRYTHKHYVAMPVAYWSQTPQGDSLLVSGKVYLPKNRDLNGIIVANHYTMTADVEVPSNMLSMESIFTMKGYAVVMPDYVGYGLSKDEIHPYLHWRSAAQTAVDLLNCMPELLDYYGYSYPKDVVVEGYSQGGAVALGVARMIEETFGNSSYVGAGVWTVRKVYAGAGPYDPAATYLYSLERDTIGIPAAIPLIVMGLNSAYDLGLEEKDFFLEPLLSNYDEWVNSKKYPVGEISKKMGSICMSELMPPVALDRNSSQAKMLYTALLWNSNVGYDLKSPAYFLHSLDDEVVPLINSLNLQAKMPDKISKTYDFDSYGSHMEASIPFMKYVYQDL